MRSTRLLWFLVLLCQACGAATAGAQSPRDRLWTLVSTCLAPANVQTGGPCPKPRADGIGNLDPACARTTEVWGQSAQYVAIRDLRMCNCPADFVHGLALPLARIAGLEADGLPEGIWQFAWDVARTKIDDAATIALVVNPPEQRSQDQLHIHLVRLRPGACEELPHSATLTVSHLDHVWQIVKQRAAEQHLVNYGVLVTRCAPDAFAVVVSGGKPTLERQYTQHDCR